MREGQLDAWATPGAENGQQTAVLLEEGGVSVCLVLAARWHAGGTELNRRFLPAAELLTHSPRSALSNAPKEVLYLVID